MTIQNPAYASGQEKTVAGELNFALYNQEICPKLHVKLKEKLPPATKVATWPQFSLDKIKLLPGEDLTDLVLANAQRLARQAKSTYGLEGTVEYITKGIYFELAAKKLSLASPFFNNLRLKTPGSLASCFILEVDDSRESIAKALDHCSLISKSGGGCGIYLGLIRASGATIGMNANAAQPISVWCKLFDQLCFSFNQLGARPGAMTIALPIWHADIEDFLEIQTEVGDLRFKSFNIQPQVVISNTFMYAVEDDAPWPLFCPKALKDAGIDARELQDEWQARALALEVPHKLVSARELWGKIQLLQQTVGRPYMFFQDAVNEGSPFSKNFGAVQASNLCVESYSFFKANEYIHTCSLISVNLGAHTSLNEIQETAELASMLVDCSLSLTTLDIPEVQNHVRDFRTIGVGLMGLADWLAFNNTSYGNLSLIEETARRVALGVYTQSLRGAQAAGPCAMSELLEPSSVMLALEAENPGLKDQRLEFGIRNALMLCTAPNTSTSLTMGACPSFLPPYDLEGWIEGNNDRASKVVLKYDPQQYVMDIKDLPPSFVLEAALAIQKWTDAGISMEFMLTKGKATSGNAEFSKLKFDAWKSGCKAIYYVRTAEAASGNSSGGSSGNSSGGSSGSYQPPRKPEDGGTCYSCAN